MRIVAFDIETTDLRAMMGQMLCASFCTIGSDKTSDIGKVRTFRADHKPWRSDDPIDDAPLAIAIRDELAKAHLVCTWNGKLFDIPFLNARLLEAHEEPSRPHMHLDLMYYARGCSLRIGSSRLKSVQQYFNLPTSKTEISWKTWQRAGKGDKAAMSEVVTHCEADVKVLAQAYWNLLPMVRNIHR